MNSLKTEIAELEEKLRQAELAPDAEFFRNHLDDDMVIMSDGELCSKSPKPFIVEAHEPGKAQKFKSVQMSDMKIHEHGNTAIVTCIGEFETPERKFKMEFMRVWAKKSEGWKVVAGAMTTLK